MSRRASGWTAERRAAQAERNRTLNVRRALPVDHCHPVVRGFFQEKRSQLASYERIAAPAGIGRDTMKNWRRHQPRLDVIDAALNVLGFEVAIVPIGSRDHTGFVSKTRSTATKE